MALPQHGPALGRREVLSLVGVSALSGCASVPSLAPDSDPRSTPDSAWPMFGYDAGRTGYHPDAAGPTASPEVRWRTRTAGEFLASPVVVGRTLYLGDRQGTLHAFDIADGTRRWHLGFDSAVNVPVAYADGTVFVGTTDGRVHAVAGGGGVSVFGMRFDVRRWSAEAGDGVLSAPAVSDGTLYAATVGGTLFAFDAKSGSVEWRYSGGGRQFSAPAVGAGRVFLNRPARRGRLVALTAETGEEKWSIPHGTDTTAAFSTPTVRDGRVFLGSHDGHVYVLDAASGRILWTVELESPTGDGLAVTGDAAFVGDRDGAIYAIDPESGEIRWTVTDDSGSAVRAPPAIAGNTLYAANAAGVVRALDAASGAERWQFDVGEEIRGGVVPLGDRLYVQTTEGTLYALGSS